MPSRPQIRLWHRIDGNVNPFRGFTDCVGTRFASRERGPGAGPGRGAWTRLPGARGAGGEGSRERNPGARHLTKMQHFRLEHPPEPVGNYYCDHQECTALADHLDVNELGHEDRLCRAHTAAQVHASKLPERAPNPSLPYRRQTDVWQGGKPTPGLLEVHIANLDQSIRELGKSEVVDRDARISFLRSHRQNEQALLDDLLGSI
jgi:hypothetical protein